MKIIGQAADGKLLLEASKNEIANLLGAYSANMLREAGLSENYLKPGVQINVKGAYEKLYWLSNRKAAMDRLRGELLTMAQKLDDSEPLFKVIEGTLLSMKSKNSRAP
jgi:hypothetical protein